MLPVLQQLVFPSVIAVVALLAIFTPLSKNILNTKSSITHNQKKVLGDNVSATPTAAGIHAPVVHMASSSTTQSHGQQISPTLVAGGTAVNVSPTPKTQNSSSPSTTQSVQPTTLPTPTTHQSTTVFAKTTIAASGKTIQLSMQYPSLGGPISGTLSGDCTGTLSGSYDGPSTGLLHGNGSATCPMGFLNIPVSITYNGKLISSSTAAITYSVVALGKTENGLNQLTLTQ